MLNSFMALINNVKQYIKINTKKLRRNDRNIRLKLHLFTIPIKRKRTFINHQCYIYSNAPVCVIFKYL